MQEHDTVIVLTGGEVGVIDAGQLLRQLGQLEIVGGEQGERLEVARQVLGGGPGQAQAIKGTGAPADLVHQHQALGGGIVENVGGFGHFHHKGGAPAGQVIRGANAGEDPVQAADAGTGCRYAAA